MIIVKSSNSRYVGQEGETWQKRMIANKNNVSLTWFKFLFSHIKVFFTDIVIPDIEQVETVKKSNVDIQK